MSKPKFDLKHPAISAIANRYSQQATIAYKQAATKDNAVRPVYALNAQTRDVQHVGSCVLLKIEDQFFGLSASHVFDHVGNYQLLFGHGDRLHSFPGDRFSSARGPSGSHQDDPIDASVFHITSGVTEEIASSFLTLQDLDVLPADRNPEFYVATGYRVSKSKSTSRGHSTRLDRYPTIELDHDKYERLRLSREMHILLAHEDQALVGGNWQTAPSIRGFSGGAIFRIPGVSPLTNGTATEFVNIKLAAILIARVGKREPFISAAVGTRLGIYFELIRRYLPGLKLDKILASERPNPT